MPAEANLRSHKKMPPADLVFCISDVHALQRLKHERPPRRTELAPTLLPEEIASDFQRKLNAELTQCGCSQVASALLVTVPLMSAIMLLFPIGNVWQSIGFILFCSLLSMLTAKKLALRKSTKKFATLLSQLECAIQNTTKGGISA